MTTIKIHFLNPNNKNKNKEASKVFLPEKFWVSRKFKRNCEYSDFDQTSGIEIAFKKEKGDNYNLFIDDTSSKDKKLKHPIKGSLNHQLTTFLN